MRINILTIFPDFFREALTLGIPGRAARDGLVSYNTVDLRDYTHDRHRTVDDEPYGGGAGMVMKPEPFFEAIDALNPQGPVALLDARGRTFKHEDAVRISLEPELTLLCGHYKDVDWRVAEGLATDVFSLGDFVLSGGESAAATRSTTRRCWPRPPTRGRPSTGGRRSRRCCAPATTRRSASGGAGRRSG
jgi:tRNA (guanine37-N1)-methyltransferase